MPRTSTVLSWERPFLPQFVERLLAQSPGLPFDLGDWFIVVPTQQAGRRLRQSLAAAAAAKGSGVLAPHIVTPDRLLAAPSTGAIAMASDVLAAWTALLQVIDLEPYAAVFPTLPPRRDARWATGLALQLASLQSQLGEHGFNFSDVARLVSGTERESERWAALSELERAWIGLLEEKELADPNSAKLVAVADHEPPPGVARIVVAGVIDPLPLSLQVLARWAQQWPVEVVSHGDPHENLFDDWGRVRPEAAAGRTLPLGGRSALRVVRDPKEAAALTAALAADYATARRSLALGAMDLRSTQALELAFKSHALTAHDPSGVALASAGLGLLAVQLLDLIGDPRPASLAEILRQPEFASFAVRTKGWAADGADLLAALDQTINAHLPNDLSTLIAFARKDFESASGARPRLDLAAALGWLAALGREFRERPLSQVLREALATIVGQRDFDLSREEDQGHAEELEQVGEILDEFASVETRFPHLKTEAAAIVLKQALQHARRFPKDQEGWDLQGWLELSYEDAPHLVLVGMNEGSVPETVRGDLFLPNSLREFLGLRSNQDRFQRDQLLLETHLRSRAETGRVDLFVPRLSDTGDPLQPSRLLFCCRDDELVPRAQQLFAELPPPRAAPARQTAWKLQPLSAPAPERFSPSKLKAYLACPYRYYLKHVLRMTAVEIGQPELSAITFGDFCHGALERLGRDSAMRDVTDSDSLARYLTDALEDIARQQLGPIESFALQVQLESGRARLRAAAEVEAEQRAEGWRIERSEYPWTLQFDEMLITGRIDRIDRHRATGAYRLIDYKTSDRGKPPEETHWVKFKSTEAHVLPESVFERSGSAWRWADLQLPLYLLAMRKEFGAEVSAGYFVLPKTKAETGLRLWTELTPEHLLGAEACARAIGAAVARRRFWPPAKSHYPDSTDYLFPDGVEASVDTAAMQALFREAVVT